MRKQHFLVLDDDPVRHDAWTRTMTNVIYTRANTLDQFNKAIWERQYDTVCLDHDLNDHSHLYSSLKPEAAALSPYQRVDRYSLYLTGVDAAREMNLLPNELLPKNVLIHSWNPRGATNIRMELRPMMDKGVRILIRPFKFEFYRNNAIKMKKDQNYQSIFWNELLPIAERRSDYY